MIKKLPLIFVIALLLGFLLFTFMVSEWDQAVVTQFSEVTKVVVNEKSPELVEQMENSPKLKNVKIVEGKGLFFKIPFIQSVNFYSDRLLTYITDAREVVTRDKKKLILNEVAQWEINNPALFMVSVKSERNAQSRLDDIIYSMLNEEIGKTEASTLISDKEYVNIMLERVAEKVSAELAPYGMRIHDIRIKRTDLPPENFENIYRRMQTERKRQANLYRSEGKEQEQEIKSEAEKEATIIKADAYETAETIKGEGDAEATRIYAEAYEKDPEFYKFYKALRTLREVIDEETTIVIPANSDLAKYLYGYN